MGFVFNAYLARTIQPLRWDFPVCENCRPEDGDQGPRRRPGVRKPPKPHPGPTASPGIPQAGVPRMRAALRIIPREQPARAGAGPRPALKQGRRVKAWKRAQPRPAVAAVRWRRHSWHHANPAVRRDNTRPVFGPADRKGARASSRSTGQGRTGQFGFAAAPFLAQGLSRSAEAAG